MRKPVVVKKEDNMPGDTLANVNAPAGQKASWGTTDAYRKNFDAAFSEEKPKKQPKKKKK